MGKEIADASAAAREVFERADQALGEKLSQLIFEGPEDQLVLTENTQPAILTTSIAVLAAAKERYPSLPLPEFAAGHSLGEYSAHVAAGSLELEDAVRLVRARGRAMQNAVPSGTGAMAAILGLDSEIVAECCREASHGEDVVTCANFNSPGQVVIAGTVAAVDRARAILSDRKGKAILLKVSAPFHCPLMTPAAAVLRTELANITFKTPTFPIIANINALPVTEASQIKDLLVRQVDGTVRFQESIERMVKNGVTHILELGPGTVLSGLIKRIAKGTPVHSVGTASSLEALGAFIQG